MGLRVLASVIALAALTPQTELVITRAGSKEYHRPHCELVRQGGDVLAMTRSQAEAKGFTPHEACDPSKAPPSDPQRPPSAATPAKPIYVFIDGGKHYHREKCAKLGRAPKRVAIEEAAKKQWPCPVCKPPIRPRKNPTDARGRPIRRRAGSG